MIAKIGLKCAKVMAKFEEFALKIKNKYSTPDCWYLYVFVTMPEFRGKGLGSKIMRPMLKYLDEHKQDCYLETLSDINVQIYKKYGFDLKEEVKVPGTDLVFYAMLRKANNNKTSN